MSVTTLVTGGSGWLGKRLLHYLVNGLSGVSSHRLGLGRSIRCLVQGDRDRDTIRSISGEIQCVRGDLRDPDSLNPFTAGAQDATLFHVAGLIHPRRIRDLFLVNYLGTQNLLRAAVRSGVRRLIHVSSNSPCGYHRSPGHIFDENAPYAPYLNYGLSKKKAEEVVARYGLSKQIETVIIRPPWFYGPGGPRRQRTFFSLVKNGKFPLVGGGDNLRSMAYLDNICQGLLLCEQSETANGRTYWISDSRPYSMGEIIKTIADVLAEDFDIPAREKQLPLPNFFGELAYLADKGIQTLGYYHQKVHVLSEVNKTIACSIARAQEELGYQPRVELREGMRRSIQALLEEGVTI